MVSNGAPVRVFLSYAWEDDAYKENVERLATRLCEEGIDARLDAWHAVDGVTIPDFMDVEIRKADKILVCCSPKYRSKVHAMQEGEKISGSGWEHMLLTSAIWTGKFDRARVVPVLFRGEWDEASPSFLAALPWTDLRVANPRFDENYFEVVRRLKGQTKTQPTIRPQGPDLTPAPLQPLRGAPGQRAELFCDRKHAAGKFRELVHRAFADAAAGPTICLAYGDAEHRPDSLIDRLIAELNLQRESPQPAKVVPWDHVDEAQIRRDLGEKLLGQRTGTLEATQLAQGLVGRQPFVIIRHNLRDWQQGTASTLAAYLEFWRAWPALESLPRVFVFLSILQLRRRSFFSFRQTPDERVPRDLAALRFPDQALIVRDLPLVTREDLDNLLMEYIPAAIGFEREEIIRRVLGQATAMPMDHVERQLKKVWGERAS